MAHYLKSFAEKLLKVTFREGCSSDWECLIENDKNELIIAFGFGDTQIEALAMAVSNFPQSFDMEEG